jgi:nucleotide-binding universal stress UspA family protein
VRVDSPDGAVATASIAVRAMLIGFATTEGAKFSQRPLSVETPMFSKILCANDGSEQAFRALALAVSIASEHSSELHMVSVEEIDYLPEFIEEIREEVGTAARQFHTVLQRARKLAEQHHLKLHTHVLAGHPVRDIIQLASELEAELLVVGSAGHSELYDRILGSRADRLVHLAPCPVLVVR